MYRELRGQRKGYARSNGHYTDPHGKPKRMYVRALRDDAREILRQRGELADCWQARVPAAVGDEVDKRSVRGIAAGPGSPPWAGPQAFAGDRAVYLLAMLSNMRGPVAAAEYAQALEQEEVVMATDAEALEVAAALCDGARAGLRSGRPTASGFAAPIATAMRYETATLRRSRATSVVWLRIHPICRRSGGQARDPPRCRALLTCPRRGARLHAHARAPGVASAPT